MLAIYRILLKYTKINLQVLDGLINSAKCLVKKTMVLNYDTVDSTIQSVKGKILSYNKSNGVFFFGYFIA